ncbi:MAG: cobalamin B12-binding domain-containing protein [Candidatus Schekmanbacteria bacterium]|nr:cobalamin B12-binding domain-containing protein [Candidatus Schekmanbacteria bacterium]
MKILLIEPPFERFQEIKRGFFPLGLTSVGTYLRKQGHEVAVYDAEVGSEVKVVTYAEAPHSYEKFLQGLANPDHHIWREVEARLKDFAPQVLGISCPTVKYESALRIARRSKRLFPQVPVIFGGCHPSALPDPLLKRPEVDYAIRGEGELTVAELLVAIEHKTGFDKIDGLSYKTQDGRIIHNPPRQLIPDLNQLPHPARDLLLTAKSYPAEDMGLIMGSRGCPFNCSYCASNIMWQRKVRYRSVEHILAEIKEVQQRYETCQFSFEDDSFTTNAKLIGAFCQEVKAQGLKINWSAITRINLLTDQMIWQMQEAGCNHIRVGIESGSAKILKDTNKGLTLDDMRRGAGILHKHGMYWSAYFMIGLPTETEEDIKATIDFLHEIAPDYATLSIFTPYPGTEEFDQLRKMGKVSEDLDWSRFSHASPFNNFALQIDKQRFAQLANEAAHAVDKHNSHFMRLLKRAKAKGAVYIQKPGELRKDIQDYLTWKKQL